MRFKFDERSTVEFKIAGYQYPKTDDKDYDGNWLNIFLDVKSERGNWKTVDPSLLTWELEGFILAIEDLLEKEVYGKDGEIEPIFIEPNLAFLLRLENNETVFMKMVFGAESKPQSWPKDEECFLQGIFSEDEIRKIVQCLKMELARFPKRI